VAASAAILTLTLSFLTTTLSISMKWIAALAVALGVLVLPPGLAFAENRPLYRVFLTDGTALVSYGEWARVEDQLVFSVPLTPTSGPSDLHLVSVPVQRVDLDRTERYADTVRAANYAASRGEADFAQLSGEVANALNQVALIEDPVRRLEAAEKARRALADWPTTHFGYRAAEVQEIVGVLDGVISGLRASAGQQKGRFDLTLSATTPAPSETTLDAPDQRQLVQNLMTLSTVVASPTEKMSLLQSVIALLDRAIDLLPAAFATSVRKTALGEMAEERRVDGLYAKLRAGILTDATRFAQRADVKRLERLRTRLRSADKKLGGRRPEEVTAVMTFIDAQIEAAHRLRLTQDQWSIRVGRLRAYQRGSANSLQTLTHAQKSLDDIRLLAGPTPDRLRPLAQRLSRAGRTLAIIEPPEEIAPVHAVFRSAYELAQNAVQLRLDAAAAADVDLARQASAAASGALMLLARGRADLDAAIRPPIAARSSRQP
jgi:hypothetical protein